LGLLRLCAVGPVRALIADKAYDANSLRQLLADQHTKAVVPSTASRSQPILCKSLYRQRNLIERMFAVSKTKHTFPSPDINALISSPFD
jgi:transposase